MQYSDWVTATSDLLDIAATITNAAAADPSSDPNFNNIIPRAIDYAENRIQRDMDLINTYVADQSGTFKASSRNFTYPTDLGTYVVVTQISLLLGTSPNLVRQQPLLPMSWEALNSFYPSDTPLSPTPSYPIYWAPTNGLGGIVGPAPDQAYSFEIVGTQRFVQMSSSNPTNFLSTFMPDVYLAASMVFLYTYQRDLGAAADDPQAVASWGARYQELMKPAYVENMRTLFRSSGWNGRLTSSIATPPQT